MKRIKIKSKLWIYILVITLFLIQTVIAGLQEINEAVDDSEDFLLSEVNFNRTRPKITFPASTSYYNPVFDRIYIGQFSGNKKSIAQHEYGHAIIKSFYGTIPSYSVGHLYGYPSCFAESSLLARILNKLINWPNRTYHELNRPMSCKEGAFNEGWASAFSMAVRDNDSMDFPGIIGYFARFESEDEFEQDVGPLVKSVNTEAITAMILWDIIDDANSSDSTPGEDDDYISSEFEKVFNVIKNENPRNILKFYNDWLKQGIDYTQYKSSLDKIYREHGIKKGLNKDDIRLWRKGMLDEDFKPLTTVIGPFYEWAFFHNDLRRTGYTPIDGDLQKGEYKDIAWNVRESASSEVWDHPGIADLDNNGLNEIVTLTSESGSDLETSIFALEPVKLTDEGGISNEFKRKWNAQIFHDATTAPSIDDLNNNRIKDVVFGTSQGIVYALGGKRGKLLWSYEAFPDVSPDRDVGQTAIADIDLDGNKEVIFSSFATYNVQTYVYVLKGNTENRDGELKYIVDFGDASQDDSGGAWGAIAVDNIDSDNYPELIVPGYYGVRVYDFNGSGLEEKWNNDYGAVEGAAVISDIDLDGEKEVIYVTRLRTCISGKNCGNTVHIRKALDGTQDKAPFNFSGYTYTSSAIANMDSDPHLEIVFITSNTAGGSAGKIQCYNYDGTTCSGSWPYDDSGTLEVDDSSVDIADINGDGNNDVIFGAQDGILYVLNRDGSLFDKYDLGGQIASAPAIADWDFDGIAEIAVKHLDSASGAMLPGKYVSRYDPSYMEKGYTSPMQSMFYPTATLTSKISIVSGTNNEPVLSLIDTIYVIEGDTIILEANATDSDISDTINFTYSSPFNSSGMWQTNDTSEGVYEILVTASDGNLSDSQYVLVTVFRNDTTKYDYFNDSTTSKILNFTENNDQVINLPFIDNDTRVWYAKLKLNGISAKESEGSFQEPTPVVIDVNEGNSSLSSSNLTDKDWDTYYSAGSATGAIVEVSDLTISNPSHIVIHLKGRVYYAGTGRFALYNYNEDYYEIVTSSIPAGNESSRDYYFDIYQGNSTLWASNETHYSMSVDNINDYINTTNNATRWYYRYLGDWASQKLYESEVKFIGKNIYPKNISFDFLDNGKTNYTINGELHELHTIQDEFNNSVKSETLNIGNTADIIRYVKLPKNAIITNAKIGLGNKTVKELNVSLFKENLFEVETPYCNDYDFYTEKLHVGVGEMTLDMGPYCAENLAWKHSDIDSDDYEEYYTLTGTEIQMNIECGLWAWGGPMISSLTDGCVTGCGEVPDPCDEDAEVGCHDNTYNTPTNSITYPQITCEATATYTITSHWSSGTLTRCYKTSDKSQSYEANSTQQCNQDSNYSQPYYVLKCGVDTDCADNKYCNKTDASILNYYCDTPVCSPPCDFYEEESISNHTCSCVLASGYCENPNTQYNLTDYCDYNNTLQETEIYIYLNESYVTAITPDERLDLDLKTELQNYLDICDTDDYCDIPIKFSINNFTANLSINYIDISYETLEFDIKDLLQSYLLFSCPDNCSTPIRVNANQGLANITPLIYTSPETKPVIDTTDVSVEINETAVIKVNDAEEDILNITANMTQFIQNGSLIQWKPNDTDTGTYNVLVKADDGLLNDEAVVRVEVIPPVPDTTNPSWKYNRTNFTSIETNENGQFNITAEDDIELDTIIFSRKESGGSWTNETTKRISGTSYDAAFDYTVTSPNEQTFQWKFYINDSFGNWNETDLFSIIIEDTITTFSQSGTNFTIIETGENGLFNITVNDADGLSGYIFSWTDSGDWINDSWIKLSQYQENGTSFKCTENWNATYPCSNVYDGSWDTYGYAEIIGETASLLVNYTKPSGVLNSSKWSVKDLIGTWDAPLYQSDVYDCWNQNPLQFKISSWRAGSTFGGAIWYCWNGVTWYMLRAKAGTDEFRVYEEAVLWDISNKLTTPKTITASPATTIYWRYYVNDSSGVMYNSTIYDFTVLDITPPSIILNTPTNNSEILPGTIINLNISDMGLDKAWYSNNNGVNNYSLSTPYDIDTTNYAKGKFDLYLTSPHKK